MKTIFLFLLFCYNNITELKTFTDELYKTDIKHKEIVLKQAILETGWFTSKVYKEKNNCFGFYTKNGYLEFDSVRDCIFYYEKWQKSITKVGTITSF